MTDISSSCFNAWVLFSFKKAICLLRASTLALQSSLSRVREAVLSLQFFRSPCSAPYDLLRESYFDCSALNFLLLTQENNKTGKRPDIATLLIRMVVDLNCLETS